MFGDNRGSELTGWAGDGDRHELSTKAFLESATIRGKATTTGTATPRGRERQREGVLRKGSPSLSGKQPPVVSMRLTPAVSLRTFNDEGLSADGEELETLFRHQHTTQYQAHWHARERTVLQPCVTRNGGAPATHVPLVVATCSIIEQKEPEPEQDKRRISPRKLKPLRTLTADLILSTCGVDNPERVMQLSLGGSEPALSGVGHSAALAQFTNLTALDLSANRMELIDLAPLLALQELTLSCNGIREVGLGSLSLPRGLGPAAARPFGALKVLDLSYNFLTADAVGELGQSLPALTELDLAGNALQTIPRDWSSFGGLTKLSLRDNKLGAQHRQRHSSSSRRSGSGSSIGHSNSNDLPLLEWLGSIPGLRELDLSGNGLAELPTGAGAGAVAGGSTPKFLVFLGLSHNQLRTQHALAFTRSLPSLRWVDIRGNPLNYRIMQSIAPQQQLLANYIGVNTIVSDQDGKALVLRPADAPQIQSIHTDEQWRASPHTQHRRVSESSTDDAGIGMGMGVGGLPHLGRSGSAQRGRPSTTGTVGSTAGPGPDLYGDGSEYGYEYGYGYGGERSNDDTFLTQQQARAQSHTPGYGRTHDPSLFADDLDDVLPGDFRKSQRALRTLLGQNAKVSTVHSRTRRQHSAALRSHKTRQLHTAGTGTRPAVRRTYRGIEEALRRLAMTAPGPPGHYLEF